MHGAKPRDGRGIKNKNDQYNRPDLYSIQFNSLDEISTCYRELETSPSIPGTPKQCLLYLVGAYHLPLPVLLS